MQSHARFVLGQVIQIFQIRAVSLRVMIMCQQQAAFVHVFYIVVIIISLCITLVPPASSVRDRQEDRPHNYNFIVNLSDDCVCVDYLNANCSKNKNFTHFWKSTGLSPLEPKQEAYKFLLSPDEKFNLLLIGSLPRNGIEQVRIHWLLYLISYDDGAYNFTHLDKLLDFLKENNLQPGFELMGLPLNVNPEDVKQNITDYWYDLVTTIAEHYIERYEYDEVQEWRFELMNEPDLKQYNFLNFTFEEYLSYARACTAALRDVSVRHRKLKGRNEEEIRYEMNTSLPIVVDKNIRYISDQRKTSKRSRKIKNDLRLGGPAGLFKQRDKHPLCWGLMDYCNGKANTSMECHLQFITFHKKGNGSAGRVLIEDLELLKEFHKKYPFLRELPVANDEADILTNWQLSEEWRGDVQYAALIAKVIIDHYYNLVQMGDVKIEVLSNDNGFINFHPNYFTQRTLLTRFQINNTLPPHVQYIKKPAYVLMGLLSLLGSEYLPVNISLNQDAHTSSDVKVIATRTTRKYINFISLLLVALEDNMNNTRYHEKVTITLHNMSNTTSGLFSKGFVIVYLLDNVSTNPYKVWKQNGRPVFPDKYVRKKMRQFEGPARIGIFDLREILDGNVIRCLKSDLVMERNAYNHFIISLNVLLPSIHFVHLCIDDEMNAPPGRPTDLHGHYVNEGEILLSWSDKKVRSRCIKTYEIEYQISNRDEFFRINKDDLIFLSYQYDYLEGTTFGDFDMNLPQSHQNRFDNNTMGAWSAMNAGVRPGIGASHQQHQQRGRNYKFYGRFRVRAIDFWNRSGKYSNIIDSSLITYL